MTLNEKLSNLPNKPGVYLFKDSAGRTLYVGKAKNLWNRVHTYFQNNAPPNPRLELLKNKIADLDYLLCDSEMEALMLEYNLIKENHPPFNILFRDDKRFPLIKLVLNDPFPYITIARKRDANDGSRYFGPYVSGDMRRILKILRKIFQIRSCTMKITGHDRPCLYYHLKECAAPCISAISREDYRKSLEGVIDFLEGKTEPLIRDLMHRMEEAASRLEYERAALIRNQIEVLKHMPVRQKVASNREEDEDYVGIAVEKGLCAAIVFHVREGKLIGKSQFIFETAESDRESILTSFIEKYYYEMSEPPHNLYCAGRANPRLWAGSELQAISKKSRYSEQGSIPGNILIPYDLEDAGVLENYLSQTSGHRARIAVPQRGERKKMLDLLEKNANHQLGLALLKEARSHGMLEALEHLKQLFHLPVTPFRIEGYDISNLFGEEAVGSMVVFQGGKPEKKHYRKFAIYSKKTPDDFAMMEEVLTRRLSRLSDTEEDESFASVPDLILLDGGRGQLSVGVKVLERLGRTDIPILSLAKQEEEIYDPKLSKPVKLSRHHAGLKVLQQVRDEAHRFAITFHKTKRDKKFAKSSLEGIAGIGKKRTQQLFESFGSIDQIKVADPEQIAKVLRCPKALAEKILAQIT